MRILIADLLLLSIGITNIVSSMPGELIGIQIFPAGRQRSGDVLRHIFIIVLHSPVKVHCECVVGIPRI